ncbi:MAG TPA: ATP-binding cassette domain-containing protein, partial [archaeon]|nr:ATP-binding cassette domain-containing protein [archaeon]
MLQTEDLTKSYKGRKVVDNLSLEVRRGEVVGLLGPNGAGKSTTFHIIIGLTLPDAGRVLLQGEELTHWPMYQRARRGISYLPQESSVFRKLTVEDNILAVLETLPLSWQERHERMEALLEQFGLAALRYSRGYMLS